MASVKHWVKVSEAPVVRSKSSPMRKTVGWALPSEEA